MAQVGDVIDTVEGKLEVLETSLDNLDSVVEVDVAAPAKGIVRFLRSDKTLVGAVVVVSMAAGGAVGYLVARKKLRLEYQKRSDTEIAEARAFYASRNNRASKPADPSTLLAEVQDEEKENEFARATSETIADTAGYSGAADVTVTPPSERELLEEIKESVEKVEEAVHHNVFDDAREVLASQVGEDFDYEAEQALRSPDRPYVISLLEWSENAEEYEQSQLTYFADDGVLCDDDDSPIPNSEALVGDANLVRFGHGSGNKDTVFVRNEVLEQDFEIALNRGSYVKDVLNFIEHSDEDLRGRGSPKKFRVRDE